MSTPLQRLHVFAQHTGSRVAFGAPTDLMNQSHAPLWSTDHTLRAQVAREKARFYVTDREVGEEV